MSNSRKMYIEQEAIAHYLLALERRYPIALCPRSPEHVASVMDKEVDRVRAIMDEMAKQNWLDSHDGGLTYFLTTPGERALIHASIHATPFPVTPAPGYSITEAQEASRNVIAVIALLANSHDRQHSHHWRNVEASIACEMLESALRFIQRLWRNAREDIDDIPF